MADTIESIPEKTRWEVATQGLTGAYIAISNALKQALGQKGFDEFNGPLWYEAGKGAKGFAETHGLATEDAENVERVTHQLQRFPSAGGELGTTHDPASDESRRQGVPADAETLRKTAVLIRANLR
ncbi:MAG: hypothetical protein GY783_18630 [Gammaproteobacteria bacterium]|nr:hypothetical protein [Gammaproteobacteria bacterium]